MNNERTNETSSLTTPIPAGAELADVKLNAVAERIKGWSFMQDVPHHINLIADDC